MKTLALLSLSLAVALGVPLFAPGVLENPVLNVEDQSALLGDLLPVQGHIVVEDPVPQVRLDSEEHQEGLSLVPVYMELSQNTVELELKVKPENGVEQEGDIKTAVKKENEAEAQPKPEPDAIAEVKDEPQGKDNQEVKVEQKPKEEPEVRLVPEDKVEPKSIVDLVVNVQPEAMAELQVDVNPDNKMGHGLNPESQVAIETNVEPEVELNPEVMADFDVDKNLEGEMEPEPEDYPDFKVGSEVKVDLNLLMFELKSLIKEQQEAQGKLQVQMNVEAETEAAQEFNERHIDMEHEKADRPIMELEPLDDDNMFGHDLNDIEVEKSFGKGPESAIFHEGQALDIVGQPIPSLEEYPPSVEARMRMEPVEGSNSEKTVEAMSQFVQGEELSSAERLPLRQDKQATRQCCCTDVLLEGKCYQFFRGPLRAEEAEFFCQEHFTGGHLASITSQHIHRELMSMMLKQNGAYTRTWIGGLRYLKTGRFVWLDGSHWSYADWLSGEPNNTSDVEDCIEVLAIGNGKFNDFTCWEPQAFICSYPYQ